MKSFFQLMQSLQEGGNVKVGDYEAEPLKFKNEKDHQAHKISVHDSLRELHDSFHKHTGHELFGPQHKALDDPKTYSGSTSHLFDPKISAKEFVKHKKHLGDIDVKIPEQHIDQLKQHLTDHTSFGNYNVVGLKRSGSELHALMQHKHTKQVHQFDFEKSHYTDKGLPHSDESFKHSSDWGDVQSGIKGVHHKVLLSVAGQDRYKFAINKGLGSRTEDKWTTNPKQITKNLFGPNADHSQIHSFKGLVSLVKKHIPSDQHQSIADRFQQGIERVRNVDHSKALNHLHSTLGTKPTVSEGLSRQTSHATVIPLVGFSPFSHMGHAHDLGQTVRKLNSDTNHIGISTKNDAFSSSERENILKRQWNQPDLNVHHSGTVGASIRSAYDSLPKANRKVLHLVVGSDRKTFAERLKPALEQGNIKEMEGHKFDEIQIHHPDDQDRSHGMSGTNMRKAAMEGDLDTFHKHVGKCFSRSEASSLMKKVKKSIDDGKIALKR